VRTPVGQCDRIITDPKRLSPKIPTDRFIAPQVLSNRYDERWFVCLFNTAIGFTAASSVEVRAGRLNIKKTKTDESIISGRLTG